MNSIQIKLPKGSILIRQKKSKLDKPINGKINLSQYNKHMYFTWINSDNSNNLIIKKLKFIEKYGPFTECFITTEDILLLDIPYTTINSGENKEKALPKIKKIYNLIVNKIAENNINEFNIIFKELFQNDFNGNYKNKFKTVKPYLGLQINYNFEKYFDKLNLNGWIRTSIQNPEANEVMLISKNVKDKILRII
jgi:hypothetical protein